MKGYVYLEKGNISIKNVDKPQMPAGGALAKILCASICGTDLRSYRFGSDHITPPRILGHEAVYLLEEVSPELMKSFKPGDKVLVAPAIGCGECSSCKKGRTNMCDDLKTIGFQYDGTFAEYCAIPKQAFTMNNVIKIEEEIKDTEACVVEPIACAINGQSFLNIQKGDNVLVFGAGFLGCIHAELALMKGADKVIIAEISEKRRNQAKRDIPGVHVVNSGDPDYVQAIKDITEGAGVDVIITACPVGAVHRQALEMINKSGRISLFGGLAGEGKGFLDSNLIHYKEVGVFGVHASTPAQNREALGYVTSGRLKVEKYLTAFPIEKIEEAFQALIHEDAVKAIIRF